MKRKSVILFFCLFIAAMAADAGNFIHPGMLHTQDDFERIKNQLANNEPAVVQGYTNLKNSKYSQSDFTTYPVEKIVRGGGVGENYMNAARGAASAYQNALRWKISGDEAHAKKAVEILNAWASVCKAVSGDTNQSLASGLYGYEFANAAELMRDYEGWRREDFRNFQEWMLSIWYPRCIDFLKRRHDTWKQDRPGHYWSNWGLCNVLGVMSIGILCDDIFIYNQGLSYYKYDFVGTFSGSKTPPVINDGLNEFLGNLVPVVEEDIRGPYGYLGQMQESGRDQGHTLMAVGLAVDICQIAWNQGDDLFSHMDNRLAAGIEYVAAYNSFSLEANELPWSEYWYHDVRTNLANAWKQTEMSSGSRGGTRPIWDRVIGHYEGIKGVKMPYTRAMVQRMGDADSGGGSYGENSGGFDHLGFSTLTCTRPAVTAEKSPVLLKQVIVYGNNSYQQGELNNVMAGSTVKLMPQLPDAETDTGLWQWDNGATAKDLEITADNSSLYRVTYTSSEGIKSTQLFGISVKGDCTADIVIPSIEVDDVTYNDSVITVFPRTPVTLNASTGNAAYGSFKWIDNSTGNTLTIPSINSDRTYSVTFTNECGVESKLNFHINISYLSASYKINGGGSQKGVTSLVENGGSVELTPSVYSSATGGTWKWSDGSTDSTLLLENLQNSGDYWVEYTYNGKTYKLNYKVQVYTLKYPIEEGNYFIRDPAENTFLTNVEDNTPLFIGKDDSDEDAQLFTITKDGSRYKIESVKDGRYVNEFGVFGTNPYYTVWNTYHFHRISDTNLYAIQNDGSSGTEYWIIDINRIQGRNYGKYTLDGFPFEMIPYSPILPVEPDRVSLLYKVYPNPVVEDMNIELPADMNNTVLIVSDINGKVAGSFSCRAGKNTVNMSGLPSSIYIGTLINDTNKTSFKIVKK